MSTTTIELSPDQKIAHDAIVDAILNKKPRLTLGGLAGTGKTTTLAKAMQTVAAQRPSLRRAFTCYTGKAADVLRRKMTAAGSLRDDDYCGTIHGLIYKPVVDKKGAVIDWELVDELDYDQIIIDEASMIDADLLRDLTSFGLPIVAVGDHGQLPPIGSSAVNLMKAPDIRLERIHRQAADNPIIRLSMLARTDGYIPYGRHGDKVVKIDDERIINTIANPQEIMFLGGYNNWRVTANHALRKRCGAQTDRPAAGEKVICLRNMRDKGIFNGMTGFIHRLEDHNQHCYYAVINMDGGVTYAGLISKYQFGQAKTLEQVPGNGRTTPVALFDWGYALTVHKAQGSEAERVVVFEQRNSYQTDDEWRRWLYTAVTRSSDELTIVKKRFY